MVQSADGKTVSVQIDATTGSVIAIVSNNNTFAVQGSHTLPSLSNASGWEVKVAATPSTGVVTVTQVLPKHVSITTVYEADPAVPVGVSCMVTVSGLASVPYTTPISTEFLVEPDAATTGLTWWAPWDRNSYHTGEVWTNPLSPSDGHTGFWDGMYNYGRVYQGGDDMVVAPLVAVLHPPSDTGWSFQMDPTEPGMAWAESIMEGINSTTAAGFAWHRSNIKLAKDTPVTFTAHIVGHAACWRPALQFHVEQYSRSWSSVATPAKMSAVDGMGSYGSYPIPQLGQNDSALNLPVIKKLHYKVNWDLSGRFYHYMGMYAPPIDGGAPLRWLNRWNPFGPNGRLTYNVSYTTGPDSVAELYQQVQAHGVATLSYMNVFEFGMNVRGHATGAAVASRPDDYRNATLYAQNHLADSVLRSNWNAEDGTVAPNQGAWDGGVLMDPGRPSYYAEMVTQTARRVKNIPNFQGMVVDRSDYARCLSLFALALPFSLLEV
jgi:hypothetical protein